MSTTCNICFKPKGSYDSSPTGKFAKRLNYQLGAKLLMSQILNQLYLDISGSVAFGYTYDGEELVSASCQWRNGYGPNWVANFDQDKIHYKAENIAVDQFGLAYKDITFNVLNVSGPIVLRPQLRWKIIDNDKFRNACYAAMPQPAEIKIVHE